MTTTRTAPAAHDGTIQAEATVAAVEARLAQLQDRDAALGAAEAGVRDDLATLVSERDTALRTAATKGHAPPDLAKLRTRIAASREQLDELAVMRGQLRLHINEARAERQQAEKALQRARGEAALARARSLEAKLNQTAQEYEDLWRQAVDAYTLAHGLIGGTALEMIQAAHGEFRRPFPQTHDYGNGRYVRLPRLSRPRYE